MRKYVWILAAVGCGCAGALAWYLLRPPPLAAVKPHLGPAIVAVYASGTVEASVMLPVAPRVGGRLIMLVNDEHAQVHRGDVLARLEAEDVSASVAQLAADAAFARTDYERNQRLVKEGAVARQVYDRSYATWRAAEGGLHQAQVQAGFMTLRAPGDCLVIQRDGEAGQYIAANTPIFWLSCNGRLRISALVDEEDVALVRPGQKAFIRADAFSGRIFEADVAEVTPRGDPVGRSYRVRIGLPRDTPLKIGMTTESNILVRRTESALLLPSAAVSDGEVWKVVQGRAQHVPVVTGAKEKAWTEIVSGVSLGDIVLADGAARPPAGRLNIRIAP